MFLLSNLIKSINNKYTICKKKPTDIADDEINIYEIYLRHND